MNDIAGKLEEAEFFYASMCESVEAHKIFGFHFSAFLTAARSVIEYTKKTSNQRVKKSRIIKFFQKKRNCSVHEKRVPPHGHVYIDIVDFISTPAIHLEYAVEDSEGNVKFRGESTTDSHAKFKQISGRTNIRTEYWFKDWKGSEDALELCRRYLDELGTIVEDGKGKLKK